MKKKILKITFVALLGVTIGICSFSSNKNANIADLTLSNIEALARYEINPECPNGCAGQGNGCECNGWHQYHKEVKWV